MEVLGRRHLRLGSLIVNPGPLTSIASAVEDSPGLLAGERSLQVPLRLLAAFLDLRACSIPSTPQFPLSLARHDDTRLLPYERASLRPLLDPADGDLELARRLSISCNDSHVWFAASLLVVRAG